MDFKLQAKIKTKYTFLFLYTSLRQIPEIQ